MATLSENINNTILYLNDIRDAIISLGIGMTSTEKVSNYASWIRSLGSSFEVRPTQLTFDAVDKEKMITVQSNEAWTVTSNPLTLSMKLTPNSGDKGKTEVTFYPGENRDATQRFGTFKTNSGEQKIVKYTQRAAEVKTSISVTFTPKPLPNNAKINYVISTEGIKIKQGEIIGNGTTSIFTIFTSSTDYNNQEYKVEFNSNEVTFNPTTFTGIFTIGGNMCNLTLT